MALEVGDAVDGTGLAGAIAAGKKEAYGDTYSVKDDAAGVNAMAAAIIDYFVENAEVTVTGVEPGEGEATGTIS